MCDLTLPPSFGDWVQDGHKLDCDEDGIQSIWTSYYLQGDDGNVEYVLAASKPSREDNARVVVHDVSMYKNGSPRQFSGELAKRVDEALFLTWRDAREYIFTDLFRRDWQ